MDHHLTTIAKEVNRWFVTTPLNRHGPVYNYVWVICLFIFTWITDHSHLVGPGPGFQVELETRFAAQAQTPWAWIIDMSELEQQILSQAPLGNRALMYWLKGLRLTQVETFGGLRLGNIVTFCERESDPGKPPPSGDHISKANLRQ